MFPSNQVFPTSHHAHIFWNSACLFALKSAPYTITRNHHAQRRRNCYVCKTVASNPPLSTSPSLSASNRMAVSIDSLGYKKNDWKKIQERTFTNWFNDRLRGHLKVAKVQVRAPEYMQKDFMQKYYKRRLLLTS